MTFFKSTQTKLLLIIGLLVVLASLWLIPGPSRQGAMVRITPNQQQVQQGYEWDAEVVVDSNVAVNSLDVAIVYPADEVKVIGTSLADSRFATPIFEPMIEDKKHEVYFVQATLEPFKGESARVGTITFKAKKPAKPQLMVNPDSKIIAHDGEGTNVYQMKLSRSVGEWLVDMLKGKG